MRTPPVRATVALLLAFFASAMLASEPLQLQIARIEQRVVDKPADFIAQTKLGELRALEARQTGDLRLLAKAESAFQNALTEFPEHSAALAGLAGVRIALHRFAEAEELARKILAIDSSNEDGKLLLLDAQLARGKTNAAERMASELPDAPATFARRSELARLRGANENAIRLALRAADGADARGDSPENRATYRVRAGELLFRTGNFERASEQYRLAAEDWPESFATAEHVAELRGATGDVASATAQYEKLFSQSERPDIAQALGDLLVATQQLQLAAPWHDRALAGYLQSVKRGEVHFIHHLAGFYADVQQNGPEAVKWARKDLELRDTPAAHDALAWALYLAGDFAAARAEIEVALSSGIKDAHVLAHAGFIFAAAGQLDRGKQLLQEAAAVNPRYNQFHVHR